MRKLMLVLVLALQFAAVVSVASADDPWPDCRKCPVTLQLQ